MIDAVVVVAADEMPPAEVAGEIARLSPRLRPGAEGDRCSQLSFF
jgi:hypothetical protein